MGLLTDELDAIVKKQEKVVAGVVADLFAELVKRTPVDTGQLRQAWSIERNGDSWIISNGLEYASIIFDGRKVVNGKLQGSTQLSQGIQPILDNFNRTLEIELRRI